MPIKNYTTTIAASKTVGEIQALLAKVGADQVIVRYAKGGAPTALVFELNGEMYMLPCRAEGVLASLKKSNVKPGQKTPEQAQRVAWRIVQDWVEAQLAIIETTMVNADEVFLPYMLNANEKTVYEQFVEQRAERLLETKG